MRGHLPPRSVWIGAHGIQTGSAERGIGRYVLEHIKAIQRADPELIGSIRLSDALPVPAALTPLLRAVSSNSASPNGRPAIYHVASPFEGLRAGDEWRAVTIDELWPAVARERDVRTVVTLHDLIPLVMRERYLDPDPFIRAAYTARIGLIRAADQLLTNSESTAEDAIALLEIPDDRVTVIHAGVTSGMASMVASLREAEAVLDSEVPGLRRPFLLYVGSDDPRKNLEGMIGAYGLMEPQLRERFQLAIACELDAVKVKELTKLARKQGIRRDRLLLTGFVPDRVLAALYRACDLFVFPSLYEGAGLPILEAMSCGAPVAASSRAAIPEVLGDLRATFDPLDASQIAACLSGLLADPEELERLRQRSRERAALHTWSRVAELTLAGYEAAVRRRAPGPAAG